ncbi:MAG: hypothetical protein IKT98_03930 [Selenomonadaceae bacterium]|nr:hypothetical protein [Selenomonadaceae bacterium]
MAQKSGFFNALLNAGVYDRTYNADDYSDNLAVVISNGVLRSENDDLLVTASGLNLSVAAGRAWINGKYFFNDSAYALPALTPPTGGSRIDRVVLRLDNTLSVRAISIQYLTGTAATSPVAPAITRSGDIYDLVLADVAISSGATSVTITDQRSNADLCGWVYSTSGDDSFFTSLDNAFNTWFESAKDTLSSVTLFKRYTWATVLASATDTVQFNVPQYDAETCFYEVYVNGFLTNAFTVGSAANVIVFNAQLQAGAQVIVNVYKSLDGTGIESVADEITALQNQYATISGAQKYIYYCTGSNDNVSLSEIAQAFYTGSYTAANVTAAAAAFLSALGGNTFLAGLADNAKMTIEVVGTCGVGAAAYGAGTAQSRYRYFNLAPQPQTSAKTLIFDFAKCDTINVSFTANTSNIIFYSTDLQIKNCKLSVDESNAGVNIQVFAGSNYGRCDVENCEVDISTTGDVKFAANGNYTACKFTGASTGGHVLIFCPDSAYMIRVIGGTFYAYCKASGKTPAIFYTYGTETNAIIIAQNISCPTVSKTGYFQQYLSVSYAGKTFIDFVVSTMNSAGNYNTITSQIWQSKA